MNVGICRPGFYPCIDGEIDETDCLYEITPRTETCVGPDLDEDCDHLVNEDFTTELSEDLDVLVVLDSSGSMDIHIPAIQSSLDQFASDHVGSLAIKMALITMPGVETPPYYYVETDLTTPEQFILHLYNAQVGGSTEPSYDVIFMAVSDTNMLGLNWTPGASRMVMLFTDETGQSLIHSLYEVDVANAVHASDTVVFLYVSDTLAFDSIPKDPNRVKDLLDSNLVEIITNSFVEICY
jgi:hypothetical protein